MQSASPEASQAPIPVVRQSDEDTELFIDAVRGLAAFAVLVTHAVDAAISDVFGFAPLSNPMPWRIFRSLFGHGGFFVWTFFVLSGFCIHQSIARGLAARKVSWSRYLLARVTRIYPLFLIGLLLAVLYWFLVKRPLGEAFAKPQFGASLFMLHAFTNVYTGYEQSWSLSNEMLYYLAWPVALILARGRQKKAVQISLMGTLLIVAVVVAAQQVFRFKPGSAALHGVLVITILYPVWIAGAWLCIHWARARSTQTLRGWLSQCVPLCLLPMALLSYVRFLGEAAIGVDIVGLTSIPGLMLLISGGHLLRLGAKSWARPVCHWLGQFSYPCYILHFQIMLLANHYLFRDVSGHPFLRMVTLILIPLAITAAIGPAIERRIMAWRKGVLARAA